MPGRGVPDELEARRRELHDIGAVAEALDRLVHVRQEPGVPVLARVAQGHDVRARGLAAAAELRPGREREAERQHVLERDLGREQAPEQRRLAAAREARVEPGRHRIEAERSAVEQRREPLRLRQPPAPRGVDAVHVGAQVRARRRLERGLVLRQLARAPIEAPLPEALVARQDARPGDLGEAPRGRPQVRERRDREVQALREAEPAVGLALVRREHVRHLVRVEVHAQRRLVGSLRQRGEKKGEEHPARRILVARSRARNLGPRGGVSARARACWSASGGSGSPARRRNPAQSSAARSRPGRRR